MFKNKISRNVITVATLIFFHSSPLAAAGISKSRNGRPAGSEGFLADARAGERRFSATAFPDQRIQNTARLQPANALIPYDLIVPFWSDGAAKSRWVAVPDGRKIEFAPDGEWVFPRGTVFVKTSCWRRTN